MDKFNIETLFPSKNDADKKKRYGKLDIRTLYPTPEQKNEDDEKFSVEIIIAKKEERKKVIKKLYKNQFADCMKKIKLAHDFHKTNLIYEIPIQKCSYPEYNVLDCVELIEKKLDKHCFDFYRFNDNFIFISWDNIQENKINSRN
jgi:hypothetical protein